MIIFQELHLSIMKQKKIEKFYHKKEYCLKIY